VEMVQHWLAVVPPALAYLIVGGVIAVESMGIPLPGEICLVGASLLAATGAIDVWWVAIAASAGAIIGDSIGYAIGRRGGRPLLERLGRRFPTHLGPDQLSRAERLFDKYGVWAIFFGRFVALLRVLAGPLAGALRVPYPRFLLANAAGGIVWAGGTSLVIYKVGQAAEHWLSRFSWVALVVAVLFGIASTLFLRARARRAHNGTPPGGMTAGAVAAGALAATAAGAAAGAGAGPTTAMVAGAATAVAVEFAAEQVERSTPEAPESTPATAR
jgi:membrane protein DedA with SNARE-associated domain